MKEKKPHCWGKMYWVLNEKEGQENSSSICDCEYGSRNCLKLTRERAAQMKTEIKKLEDADGKLNIFGGELKDIFYK